MIEDWIGSTIGGHIRYTGLDDEIHICCPICGEIRYRLYINTSNGQVYCHNCQFKGNVVNLIQYVEGVSYATALQKFKDIKGNIILPENIENALEKRLMAPKVDVTKRPVPLPKEYQLISQSSNFIARRATNYLNRRGITDKQIAQCKMGICSTGEYHHRIIIPVYLEDNLTFWVARAMSKTVPLKEKSPSNTFYQYGKSEVIFNLDRAARQYHSAVISEGIFDALSWGKIGISLLGKVLYDSQLDLLLQYKSQLSEGLYIALDADAEADAMKMAGTLSEFFDVKIIRIPAEFDDPNNYLMTHSKRAMWNLITCADEYGEFTTLRSRLQNL